MKIGRSNGATRDATDRIAATFRDSLRATLKRSTGRMRPAGRWLPTPAVDHQILL